MKRGQDIPDKGIVKLLSTLKGEDRTPLLHIRSETYDAVSNCCGKGSVFFAFTKAGAFAVVVLLYS